MLVRLPVLYILNAMQSNHRLLIKKIPRLDPIFWSSVGISPKNGQRLRL